MKVCVFCLSGSVASRHLPPKLSTADHTQVYGGLVYLLRSKGKTPQLSLCPQLAWGGLTVNLKQRPQNIVVRNVNHRPFSEVEYFYSSVSLLGVFLHFSLRGRQWQPNKKPEINSCDFSDVFGLFPSFFLVFVLVHPLVDETHLLINTAGEVPAAGYATNPQYWRLLIFKKRAEQKSVHLIDFCFSLV